MRLAISRMRAFMGLIAVPALALSVSVTGICHGGEPGGKGKLAPNLAYVPQDAFLFVQVRVADIWDQPLVKVLRQLGRNNEERPGKMLAAQFGLAPADIESLIVVFQDFDSLKPRRVTEFGGVGDKVAPPDAKPDRKEPPNPCAGEHVPAAFHSLPGNLVIVTAKNKIDAEKLAKDFLPGAREAKLHDKIAYLLGEKEGRCGICVVNDRTYLLGFEKNLAKAVAKPAATETKGPLAAALTMAAGNHAVVVGMQIPAKEGAALEKKVREAIEDPDHLHGFGDLTAVLGRVFLPLLKVKSGALSLDLGQDVEIGLHLDCATEPSATRVRQSVRDGLTLLRIFGVGSAILHMKNEANNRFGEKTEEGFLMAMLAAERVEKALKTVKVEKKEAAVEVALKVPMDFDTLSAEAKTLAKKRSGDEKTILARNRRTSQNNLKQIVLAFHNYNDTYRNLPPAIHGKDGKPLLSWRVLILPYIEQDNLYKQFKLDEPWDSEHNKKLIPMMPKIYAAPGIKTKEAGQTYYQLFVGKDAAFDTTPRELRGNASIPASFPDGTSNTIMVVEGGDPVIWSKPNDLPFDMKKELPKLGGIFKAGMHAGLADGSVRFFKRPFNEKTLKLWICPNDGMVIPNDDD